MTQDQSFSFCREERSQETVLTKVGLNYFYGKTVCERGMSGNEWEVSLHRTPVWGLCMGPKHKLTVFGIQQGSNQTLSVFQHESGNQCRVHSFVVLHMVATFFYSHHTESLCSKMSETNGTFWGLKLQAASSPTVQPNVCFPPTSLQQFDWM